MLMSLLFVLLALLCSGVSGILNQVVWQRALKVFLGGSETISAMVVVLVFIGGLGTGSLWMGMKASRFKNPLRALGLVELLLCGVNLAIAIVLGLEIRESIYAVQRLAVSMGLPLRLLYAVGALLVLGAPCFLMGVTMPLSSEVCQRQLGVKRSALIPLLFFVNTGGAVIGGLAGGFYFLPHYGQWFSLQVAALGNLLAGLVLLALSSRVGVAEAGEGGVFSLREWSETPLRVEEIMAAAFGFLSLGYEMYLLRMMALIYQPLPYTFAATLCLFLLFWSLGTLAAVFVKERIPFYGVLAGVLVMVSPMVFSLHRFLPGQTPEYVYGLVYFAPCFCFGILYGHLVSRSARQWGRDVGRFFALNSFGSVLGILFFTFVGYEVSVDDGALVLAGLLVLAVAYFGVKEMGWGLRAYTKWAIGGVVVVTGGGLLIGLVRPYSDYGVFTGFRVFSGRDGVIEVKGGRDMIWDGLWHSEIVRGNSHIGANNWLLAVAPVVAHQSHGSLREALVVGLGTGITATTLTRVPGLTVEVYDINRTLERVLAAYPEGTLHVARNDRVSILWQDGRSGLALSDKKYDLITQQPLYLSQAGSSILLSREYFDLVKSRLNPFGVFCIYSNAGGNPAQGLLVRETAASVFKYTESFQGGYLILASQEPMGLSAETIGQRLQQFPALADEAKVAELRTGISLSALFDAPRLPWSGGGYLITDNHPLVEYPDVVAQLVPVAVQAPKTQ